MEDWSPWTNRRGRPRALWLFDLKGLVYVGLPVTAVAMLFVGGPVALVVLCVCVVLYVTGITTAGVARVRRRRRRLLAARELAADPLRVVRRHALQAGGGVYLGQDQAGGWRHGRPERAVLVLGPPRSGKSSGVIIPAVLAHTGPVVCTSTKPDVAAATWPARSSGGGRTWVFDPTGTTIGAGGLGEVLRWSPVTGAGVWDEALLIARSMTSSIGAGTTDRSHWSTRAQALLAPLLHAAAVRSLGMDTVVGWVMAHDLDEPGGLLEDPGCSQLAFGSLLGIFHTEARERSSIFSACADALQAYQSESALSAARNPNFDSQQFVTSADTVYVHCPAEEQAAAAPLVCGLLSEIRRATYRSQAAGLPVQGRMLFALDEVANIAPLEDLPQIASEAGGQGLILLAALQDLSQARARWGAQADGFLTLFGTKLILRGVADTKTLEQVSLTLGEYDRQVISRTTPHSSPLDVLFGGKHPPARGSTTYSTQRTRVLTPGEIANLPAGTALHLDGVLWERLTLTPAHTAEPWHSITTRA